MSPAARQALSGSLVTVVIALLSLVISAVTAYHDNDKSITSRVGIVEARQEDDRKTLGEIKATVDQIYQMLLREHRN